MRRWAAQFLSSGARGDARAGAAANRRNRTRRCAAQTAVAPLAVPRALETHSGITTLTSSRQAGRYLMRSITAPCAGTTRLNPLSSATA